MASPAPQAKLEAANRAQVARPVDTRQAATPQTSAATHAATNWPRSSTQSDVHAPPRFVTAQNRKRRVTVADKAAPRAKVRYLVEPIRGRASMRSHRQVEEFI